MLLIDKLSDVIRQYMPCSKSRFSSQGPDLDDKGTGTVVSSGLSRHYRGRLKHNRPSEAIQ